MKDWSTDDREAWDNLSPSDKQLFRRTFDKFIHTLYHNGWVNSELKSDDFSVYKFTLISDDYECTIHAYISSRFLDMTFDGEMGIEWLELEYEYEQPYTVSNLKDMLAGIKYAEQNLISIGVPFVKNYRFHQDTNSDNKRLTRLNQKLIKSWRLDELEQLNRQARGWTVTD